MTGGLLDVDFMWCIVSLSHAPAGYHFQPKPGVHNPQLAGGSHKGLAGALASPGASFASPPAGSCAAQPQHSSGWSLPYLHVARLLAVTAPPVSLLCHTVVLLIVVACCCQLLYVSACCCIKCHARLAVCWCPFFSFCPTADVCCCL